MARVPTLAETQRLLWTLLSAPEGAAAALAASGAQGERLRAEVEEQIAGDARLSATERLDIYAEQYFYRVHDCLAEDFPALRAVIGETRFHNLVTDYLLAHPSTHPSLRFVGRRLATFVVTHALCARWPFLGDLVRLEWALLDAFDAADATPLTEATLAALPADAWAELRLRPVPSLRLLDLEWLVDDTWTRVQRREDPGAPAAGPASLLVWRRDLCVLHRRLERAERQALGAVGDGRTFADVCDAVADTVESSGVATLVTGFVRRWLTDEVLAARVEE
jgi:hypothetical protein